MSLLAIMDLERVRGEGEGILKYFFSFAVDSIRVIRYWHDVNIISISLLNWDMDRDPTQKQYFTSQSTIVSSQFPASKQLPTFNHNYNDIYDTNKYQGGYYYPQQYSGSINRYL